LLIKKKKNLIFHFIYIYSKLWLSYRYLASKGIQTPPYRFIFGNLLDMLKDKNESNVIAEYTKKYGKTYGYLF